MSFGSTSHMKNFTAVIGGYLRKLFRFPVESVPLDQFEIETDQERRASFLRFLNGGWLSIAILTLLLFPVRVIAEPTFAAFISRVQLT